MAIKAVISGKLKSGLYVPDIFSSIHCQEIEMELIVYPSMIAVQCSETSELPFKDVKII